MWALLLFGDIIGNQSLPIAVVLVVLMLLLWRSPLDVYHHAAPGFARATDAMKSPVELWVYLSASPLIWLTMTMCVWVAAVEVSARVARHPLANPVLSSIVVLSIALWLFKVPYQLFFAGAQFVHFLLGPATIAIAIPLDRQWDQVKGVMVPMLAALSVGSFAAVGSVIVLGRAFGLSHDVLISFLPKSATAGVAMAISTSLGGNPSLTAVGDPDRYRRGP